MQSALLKAKVHLQRPFVPATKPATRFVVVRSTGWADPAANSAERTMFGEDMGARNATPGELASNFSDKTLGNYDTEHIIKIPEGIAKHLGLSSRTVADPSTLSLLEPKDLELKRQQVPGWRVQNNKAGMQCIRQEWTLKDASAAAECVKRITDVAQKAGHMPEITTVSTMVVAELTTVPLGGVTENDLIVASKINDLVMKDLLQQKKTRYWA